MADLTGTKIMTFTGKMVDPFNLILEDICIEDVAHSLSFICRFNGHVKSFYSVAAHSYYVYEEIVKLFPNDHLLQLTALLHDSGETYFNDLPAPIKHSSKLINYNLAENIATHLVLDTLGAKKRSSFAMNEIKKIDHNLFCTESFYLQHHFSPSASLDRVIPGYYSKLIVQDNWEGVFLSTYKELRLKLDIF